MKLIQAMKKIKDLTKKAEDLRDKVSKNCSHLSIENPTYGEGQKAQVSEWIQSHHDVLKEIQKLRVGIARTNLATAVTIELGGHQLTKSISEWIHRRRDLAKLEMDMWSKLTDRNLRESDVQTVQGGPVTKVRIVRHFDPAERDGKMELFRSEPSIIDANLEVVNATTDLIEESSAAVAQ